MRAHRACAPIGHVRSHRAHAPFIKLLQQSMQTGGVLDAEGSVLLQQGLMHQR